MSGLAVTVIDQPTGLFEGARFSVAMSADAGDERLLHPAERALVAVAAPKRRADFAAGRSCAHRALSGLAMAPAPLLRDPHGAPLWPAGTVGSISHTEGCAVSVVALRAHVCALGVDVERIDARAANAVLAAVCTDAECEALLTRPTRDRVIHACALFSAKESIYKCLYAATGMRLGYRDADVTLDLPRGRFEARLRSREGRQWRLWVSGRVGCNDRHVFTGLHWPCDCAATARTTLITGSA